MEGKFWEAVLLSHLCLVVPLLPFVGLTTLSAGLNDSSLQAGSLIMLMFSTREIQNRNSKSELEDLEGHRWRFPNLCLRLGDLGYVASNMVASNKAHGMSQVKSRPSQRQCAEIAS